VKEKKAITTCRKCHRMVYDTDTDAAGRCCFCAEAKPEDSKA
jgi:hypothetical protein